MSNPRDSEKTNPHTRDSDKTLLSLWNSDIEFCNKIGCGPGVVQNMMTNNHDPW